MSLLDIQNLSLEFTIHKETTSVLRGVTLQVEKGSRTAIVGESGSGKTVTALSIARLLPASAQITSGKIFFEGQDLLAVEESALRQLRGTKISMIFQNASASLNPLYPVGQQIADVYRHHFGGSKKEAWEKAVDVLASTGIPNPKDRARDYPHQYSGGMAQRAMVAMALVCEPTLLIADEPTTGLDVTIQIQVLDLIQDIVERLDATLIMITHDIAVVSSICDQIVVMYAGGVMEAGPAAQLLEAANNPYTVELLKCFSDVDGDEMPYIAGRIPDLRQSWAGCSFAPRCPHVSEICHDEPAPMTELSAGHHSVCHFAAERIHHE